MKGSSVGFGFHFFTHFSTRCGFHSLLVMKPRGFDLIILVITTGTNSTPPGVDSPRRTRTRLCSETRPLPRRGRRSRRATRCCPFSTRSSSTRTQRAAPSSGPSRTSESAAQGDTHKQPSGEFHVSSSERLVPRAITSLNLTIAAKSFFCVKYPGSRGTVTRTALTRSSCGARRCSSRPSSPSTRSLWTRTYRGRDGSTTTR